MNKISIYPGYNYRSTSNFQRFALFFNSALFATGCLILFVHESYILSSLFFVASVFYFLKFITSSVKSIAGLKKKCCYYKIDQFNIRVKKWYFGHEHVIKWKNVNSVEIHNYRTVTFYLSRSKHSRLRLGHLSYKRRYAIVTTIDEAAKELNINVDYSR